MCSVDLKREIISQDLLIVYARTNLYEFACCLFSVLQLTVWMPFQRLYVGQRSLFKIHNGGNSRDVQGFCMLLEFGLQRHFWEFQGFRGLP